jgi:hypothetical protein
VADVRDQNEGWWVTCSSRFDAPAGSCENKFLLH